MKIHSYLTFSGNCREAMTFYQSCLGGTLRFQTIGDSPLSEKMPQRMKDCILHAALTKNDLTLLASDMVGQSGLNHGNAVSLSLSCGSEEEIRSCFEKLSAGGIAEHPLEDSFWGALFGNLTDKYGNHWLLNYERKGIEY
ncbi:VOC family protein [Reichenbachiella agarivorans]|uniref:VOC family protein n=1 Tax=Reichenbachiella agarivorans TaxID=2979464 RepID=A0ABY6CL53_9BACT|nr:VOC family protein [Reichenbachiella agarivorans]UXP31247.1 VOC family protein [Reichenbachiella agarivorans]